MQGSRPADLIARVEDAILDALARGDPPSPEALLFLLRRYMGSSRPAVADQLGEALAVALTRGEQATGTIERAGWLRLFVDAALASDDDRIHEAIAALVERLSAEWTTHTDVERAGASIDACLQASDESAAPMLQRAIDELERVVGVAYKPGGEARSVGESVRLASALLTAFALTARLPYAMLAEELVQALRRTHWNARDGFFSAPLELNCEAARVLGRLAALHRDVEYCRAAVVAPDADYDRDLDSLLDSLAAKWSDEGFPRAAFGLALLERVPESM